MDREANQNLHAYVVEHRGYPSVTAVIRTTGRSQALSIMVREAVQADYYGVKYVNLRARRAARFDATHSLKPGRGYSEEWADSEARKPGNKEGR